MMKPDSILIIRLGALGDLASCFQGFQDIRAAHPDARIALLTMPAFAGFARAMPWFDEVIVDERPRGWRVDQWWALRNRVRAFAPTRIYDLQGKRRQSILYGLLGGPWGVEWSGAAPFCSHPRLWPPQPDMGFPDFIAAQLRRAGVPLSAPADLSWLDASVGDLGLPPRFALLIPGCGAGRPYKRWPAASYAALADRLRAEGIPSVVIGTQADRDATEAVCALSPHVINLTGRTNLLQLGGLARRAAAVIGNDSGPTHIMAACGAPTVALMSDRVNAVWSAPRGPKAQWMQGKPLESLNMDEVFLALSPLLDRNV